jgi:hypothetical protein
MLPPFAAGLLGSVDQLTGIRLEFHSTGLNFKVEARLIKIPDLL